MIYAIEGREMVLAWVAIDKDDFIDTIESATAKKDHVIWEKMTGNEILDMFNVEDLAEAREHYQEANKLWDSIEEYGLDSEYYRSFEHEDFTPDPIPDFETYKDYLELEGGVVFENAKDAKDALEGNFLTLEQKVALKKLLNDYEDF